MQQDFLDVAGADHLHLLLDASFKGQIANMDDRGVSSRKLSCSGFIVADGREMFNSAFKPQTRRRLREWQNVTFF